MDALEFEDLLTSLREDDCSDEQHIESDSDADVGAASSPSTPLSSKASHASCSPELSSLSNKLSSTFPSKRSHTYSNDIRARGNSSAHTSSLPGSSEKPASVLASYAARKKNVSTNPSGYHVSSKKYTSTNPSGSSSSSRPSSSMAMPNTSASSSSRAKGADDKEQFEREEFSKLRIKNRKVSAASIRMKFMGCTVQDLRTFKRESLKKANEGNTDAIIVAVLTDRRQTQTSGNGNRFAKWELANLRDTKLILFLFGEAQKKFSMDYSLKEGSIVAISCARILPANPQHPQAISIDSDEQMIVLGECAEFGRCQGKRKDGQKCTVIVNTTGAKFCEFHLSSAYNLWSRRPDCNRNFAVGIRKDIKQRREAIKQHQLANDLFNVPEPGSKKRKKPSQRSTTCLPPVNETRLLEATLERRRRISENSVQIRKRKRREYLAQNFMSSRKNQLLSSNPPHQGNPPALRRSRAAMQAPLVSQLQKLQRTTAGTVPHRKTQGRSAIAMQNASKRKSGTTTSSSSSAGRAKTSAPVNTKAPLAHKTKAILSTSKASGSNQASRKPLSPRNMNVENRKTPAATKDRTGPPKLSMSGFDDDFELEFESSPMKSAASCTNVSSSKKPSTSSSKTSLSSQTSGASATRSDATRKPIISQPSSRSSPRVVNTSFASHSLSRVRNDHSFQPIEMESISQGFSSESLAPSRQAVAHSRRRRETEESLAKQRAAEILRGKLGGAPLAKLDPNNHKAAWATTTLTVNQCQEVFGRSKNKKRPRFGDGLPSHSGAPSAAQATRKKPRTDSSSKHKKGEPVSDFAKQFGHRLKGRTAEDLKSKYAASLEDEQTEKLDEMLGHMAKGEEILEKMSKLHQKKILAAHCAECNTYSFKTRQVCIQKHHRTKRVETVQRFFACGGCGRRDYTIHKRFMDRSCFDCGSSIWQKTGQRSNVATDTTGLRLRNQDHMTSSRAGVFNALRAEKRQLVDKD